MSRVFIISLLAISFVASLNAQQPTQSSSPDGTQSTGTQGGVDCSDPSQAGGPDCSLQTQRAVPNQIPQARTPQTDRFGNQPGRPRGRYSDTEQLNGQQLQRDQIQEQTPPAPLTEFQKFVASTTGQI